MEVSIHKRELHVNLIRLKQYFHENFVEFGNIEKNETRMGSAMSRIQLLSRKAKIFTTFIVIILAVCLSVLLWPGEIKEGVKTTRNAANAVVQAVTVMDTFKRSDTDSKPK